MTEDVRPAVPDVTGWLEVLRAHLPAGVVDEAGPEERAVLLDLARIAAHRSHRIAAPVTTYLAGVAYAGLPGAERLAKLRELATALEV